MIPDDSNYKICLIFSGLSPIGPFWDFLSAEKKLNKGQAEFVDVIHTAQDQDGVGSRSTVADIEFRPNGGLRQPLSKDVPDIHSKPNFAVEYLIRESQPISEVYTS